MQDTQKVAAIAAKWSEFDWPLRPDETDVASFATGMPRSQASQTLVLGATPELIDLLLGPEAVRVTSIDHSGAWVAAMEHLADGDWQNLARISRDWRERDVALAGRFDVIIGDIVLLHLPYPEGWSDCLAVLTDYLGPGGRILMRGLFRPEANFDFESWWPQALQRLRQAHAANDHGMFRQGISTLRLATAVAALGLEGTIARTSRNQRLAQVKAALLELFPQEPWRTTLEMVLFQEPTDGEGLIPLSIPDWQETRTLFAAAGLDVEVDEARDLDGFPGVVRFFSAVKRP